MCLIFPELIQTELHHMRTLRIMEHVFRQGMLEDVQLDPGVVHVIFPCLDQLIVLHSRFLAQLILRRNYSLQAGSSYNFTILQLGDVLLEQVSKQQLAYGWVDTLTTELYYDNITKLRQESCLFSS